MTPDTAIAVVVADDAKPSPERGGPCATCALRVGTDANQASVTMLTVELCLMSGEPFYCHEHNRVCKGWIAAANAIACDGEAVPDFQRRVAAVALDQLGDCIDTLREGQPIPSAETLMLDLLTRVGKES